MKDFSGPYKETLGKKVDLEKKLIYQLQLATISSLEKLHFLLIEIEKQNI